MFWTHLQRPKCSLTVWVPQTHSLSRHRGKGFLSRLSCVSLSVSQWQAPVALAAEEDRLGVGEHMVSRTAAVPEAHSPHETELLSRGWIPLCCPTAIGSVKGRYSHHPAEDYRQVSVPMFRTDLKREQIQTTWDTLPRQRSQGKDNTR